MDSEKPKRTTVEWVMAVATTVLALVGLVGLYFVVVDRFKLAGYEVVGIVSFVGLVACANFAWWFIGWRFKQQAKAIVAAGRAINRLAEIDDAETETVKRLYEEVEELKKRLTNGGL